MIRQTNQIFEQNQLTARPIEQFRHLYPNIEFNPEHKEQAQQIKADYNSLVKQRIQLEEWGKNERGPYLVITSPITGKQLEITNLIQFDMAKNPDFWKCSQLSIRVETRKPTKSLPHTFRAILKDENYKDVTIGTISIKSAKEHDIKPGMTIQHGKVEFYFGISDGMIDALKQQTREFVESVREEIPLEEKTQLAAAIHDVSHTGESKNYSGLKRAGVAFAVFPDNAIAQLQNLQFTQMRVIGTQFNECAGRNVSGEKVAIKFEDGVNPREPSKTARWVTVEGKKLGVIDARSPQLLAGYEAIASITSSPSTCVIVTSLKNPTNQIQIDRVHQYGFSDRNWQGEQVKISLEAGQEGKIIAKLDNQILGVLNKQSVDFLTQQLAAKGRAIQGLSITGTVNKAPPSYADITIDPDSVKFPESETSNVATVLIINGEVEPKYQVRTQQVFQNMIERAIARAMENGFDRVQFVDISPNPTPYIQEKLQRIAGEWKDIEIEFIGIKSPEAGMQLLTKPSDIILGIKTAETIGVIDFVSNQGKAIATYIPETGRFERQNLFVTQKARRDLLIDR